MSAFRSLRQLVIPAVAMLLGAGCVPIPGHSQYMRYDIDLTANGRHYAFEQFFECYRLAELSEADGNFHPTTRSTGGGTTTVDIGDGLVLLLAVGGCESGKGKLPTTILVNPQNPDRLLFLKDGMLDRPSVVINRVRVGPVANPGRALGPTIAEAALKEQIRNNQHGFQRVTARIIPQNVWATSEDIRAYFKNFHEITVAKVGEESPPSGWPAQFVQFKFAKQRAVRRYEPGLAEQFAAIPLNYNGEAFEFSVDKTASAASTWYATHETRNNKRIAYGPEFAKVVYKGKEINLRSFQEIFDPETQNIIQLSVMDLPYPWGGPDKVDIERIMSSKK